MQQPVASLILSQLIGHKLFANLRNNAKNSERIAASRAFAASLVTARLEQLLDTMTRHGVEEAEE